MKHSFIQRMLIIIPFCLAGLLVLGSYTAANIQTMENAPASSFLPDPAVPTGPDVPTALNMGMPGGLPISRLHGPQNAAHQAHFTLTAQAAQLALGNGSMQPAWTFNGTAPGPTLRVRQGDLVMVTVTNHLPFGITIHWHGVSVPNAEDGVAGVTQDAIRPGQSYTYHFLAQNPGTYWYHSHQFSYEETTGGLYGMLIIDPATQTVHDDVDYSVALHDWNGANNQTLHAFNDSVGTLTQMARPGQWVRLRIANTSSNQHLLTLIGTPFQVVALDGHDLHEPQMLNEAPIPLGAAQRCDLRVKMPTHGSVALVTSTDERHYQTTPAVVLGPGSIPSALPAVKPDRFDFTTYGTPAPDPITLQSHFDATYSITLGNHMGTSLGRMGMTYTLNGKTFPNADMIMIRQGQLVRLHFDNPSELIHPMHLHGHVFTVLARNGKALDGSPVHLDTINIQPHESYDVAFVANNPGIWMLHCHNLLHANWGMDMMIMYNVATPYTIGNQTGNFPD